MTAWPRRKKEEQSKEGVKFISGNINIIRKEAADKKSFPLHFFLKKICSKVEVYRDGLEGVRIIRPNYSILIIDFEGRKN